MGRVRAGLRRGEEGAGTPAAQGAKSKIYRRGLAGTRVPARTNTAGSPRAPTMARAEPGSARPSRSRRRQVLKAR